LDFSVFHHAKEQNFYLVKGLSFEMELRFYLVKG
jgi:hypothetical protein